MSQPDPADPATRPPLQRLVRGRRLAGVAGGLARHLGAPVRAVRWGFGLAAMALGVGLLLYIFLWIFMPAQDQAKPPIQPWQWLRKVHWAPWRKYGPGLVVGLVLLVVGLAFVAWRHGIDLKTDWWLPIIVMIGGLVLAWSQLDKHDDAGNSVRSGVSLLRLLAGLALVTAGVVLLMGRQQKASQLLFGTLAGLAVVAGVAVVLAPWWLRLWRQLGDERSARARESERADIAAHLHDSVLQTLAVMRAKADDPDLIRRLARSQERELRAWLYEETAPPTDSVAAGLRAIVAQIEDEFGVEIGTVIVGDAAPDIAAEALLRAAREALLNAVRHGAPPVSVYLEVSDRGTEAFIRDHGSGFDLANVPSDRLGVRESIIGRIERQSGSATVGPAKGKGTEVRLMVTKGGSDV